MEKLKLDLKNCYGIQSEVDDEAITKESIYVLKAEIDISSDISLPSIMKCET